VRAWHAETGGLPVNLTVLLEGEEESASPSMVPFLTEHADELKAEIALVCDTGMWDRKTPAITTMLRGLVYEEVFIQAASHDLHSGAFGSAARNPIHVLAKILADMRDHDGRITIPASTTGCPRSRRTEAAVAVARLRREGLFRRDRALGSGRRDRLFHAGTDLGTSHGRGERHRGGYIGEGRQDGDPGQGLGQGLVPPRGEQDPATIRGLRAFDEERLPPDCKANFLSHGGDRAVSQPSESVWVQKAKRALSQEWGRDAAADRDGRLHPDCHPVQRILGMDSLLIVLRPR
jgi:hypothetical protein